MKEERIKPKSGVRYSNGHAKNRAQRQERLISELGEAATRHYIPDAVQAVTEPYHQRCQIYAVCVRAGRQST